MLTVGLLLRAVRDLIGLLDDPGFAGQPAGISSIRGFPGNVPIRGTALWSLGRILDRAPPFELKALFVFPRRPPDRFVTDGIARRKTWWKAHRDEARYRPPSD